MQLFLRIYAVVYLLLYAQGLFLGATHLSQQSVVQIADLIFFMPVAVVGLFSAAYRHLNLPRNSWKLLLFVSVFWRPLALGSALLSGDAIPKFQQTVGKLTLGMSADNALAITLLCTAGICLAGSLLVVPPLIGLYRNAYGDESLLKLMSPSQISVQPPPGESSDQLAQMAPAAQPENV